ncbi:MAG TPA: hypothetical protein VK445_00895 [Dissulfurispiraceae bacterium]|nr:hypothetical protein [Dissulfurispiraceae bacterium]
MKSLSSLITVTGLAISLTITPALALAAGTDDPGIQQREINQQKRIDQGIKSGQLSPREAGKLETQQAKIKQDESRMKSDGKLTKKERAKLTREQNRASKNIYKKKHNERRVNTGEGTTSNTNK